MTSINALRFDRYSGIIIGDESISTVADMRVNLGEKVRSFVPPSIVEAYGTVGAIGTTGTCSMGDTIQEQLENRLKCLLDKEIEKTGRKPDRFMNMEEMARLCFDIVIEVKNKRISEKVKGTYNFTTPEFVAGKYVREGKDCLIDDKDTVREVLDQMIWRYSNSEVNYVFMNAGLVAGYDDENGFQIFHFDLRDGYWHMVQNCYMAEGSGRHSVDPAIYGFAEKWLTHQRRGNLDPVEGSIALIHGVNKASLHEIGVGGYYNIILIDGRKDHRDRMWEINDERSLLANHVVRGLDHGFIGYDDAYRMIDSLLFKNAPFQEVYQDLWGTARRPEDFSRILRGYKFISRQMV